MSTAPGVASSAGGPTTSTETPSTSTDTPGTEAAVEARSSDIYDGSYVSPTEASGSPKVTAAISYFNGNYNEIDPNMPPSKRDSYLEPVSCQSQIYVDEITPPTPGIADRRNTYLEIASK